MNDEVFMRLAIEEAQHAAAEGNWPMGCVIVLDDQIIARAHNTGYSEANRMAHAELKALESVKDILEQHKNELTLYTTSEPCPMCFGAIVLMKVKRVVVGFDADQSGSLDLQEHLPPFFAQPKFHFEVTRGVLAAECREVYEAAVVGRKHLQKVSKDV
jgi:tRNA(adenine34) deaminase